MFVDLKHLDLLKFKGCEECVDCCKKPMAPLILDDFEKVYKYFPILIAELDTLKPVMLLSNKISCPYLKDNKCSIYINRPPACKIYPYSPWYDTILLDLSCRGVGIEGKYLPMKKEDFLYSEFYEERFDNIINKIKKTEEWLNTLKLTLFNTYHGINIYTIAKHNDKHSFFQMGI